MRTVFSRRVGKRHFLQVSAACSALLIGSTANAAETITYTYDTLGRLVSISTSGGPNNNLKTLTCFDAAGNRVSYQVTTSTPTPC